MKFGTVVWITWICQQYCSECVRACLAHSLAWHSVEVAGSPTVCQEFNQKCVNLRERNFGQNILGLVSGISWQHCFVVNVFQPSSASCETKPCCDQLLDCNLHWSRLWHYSVFVPREERTCVQSREEHHVVGSTAGSVTGMPSVFIHSFTWKKF